MESSVRRVICSYCYVDFLICRRCDRGQRYCGKDCSSTVRVQRQREAKLRYQTTFRGQLLHARRQGRYRARKKRVTDHGSAPSVVDAVLTPDQAVSVIQTTNVHPFPLRSLPQCHFCGHRCSDFVRRGFLRSGESGVFPG